MAELCDAELGCISSCSDEGSMVVEGEIIKEENGERLSCSSKIIETLTYSRGFGWHPIVPSQKKQYA